MRLKNDLGRNGLSKIIKITFIHLLKLLSQCKDTVLPTKSDSDVMFCLQSYQGLIID